MGLTLSEVKELEVKLHNLESVELAELNKTIAVVKDDESNSAENGALFALLAEREALKNTISDLKRRIKKAEIIDDAVTADVIAIGTSVELKDEDGEVMEYKIVSEGLGDPINGKLSCDSPLGKQLMGKSIREIVEFEYNKIKNKFIVNNISLCA